MSTLLFPREGLIRPSDGLIVPRLPLPRPRTNKRRMSLLMGFWAVLDENGQVIRQDDDWHCNALHDAGEQAMLNTYLKEVAHVTPKYLGLLADGAVAETDGTMSAVTELRASPPVDGYARQPIVAANWTDDGLQGGDYRFSAAEQTFGAATATWTGITHCSLSTTQTTAGALLLTLALSASTNIAIGQFFKLIFRWTQQ